MRVLIACECSGVVRRAFRALGHSAWSNDLEPAEDGSPFHLQGDCRAIITLQNWDLIIMHPDCTCMSLSGNTTYAAGKAKHSERVEQVQWTLDLWELAKEYSPRVVLENPASVIFPHLRKRGANVQFIQPHQFGHPEFKKTGLALHGVEPLMPTKQLKVPGKDTEEYKRWERVFRMAPSDTRKADRARTYTGIGSAMAEQWGGPPGMEKAIEIVLGLNA